MNEKFENMITLYLLDTQYFEKKITKNYLKRKKSRYLKIKKRFMKLNYENLMESSPSHNHHPFRLSEKDFGFPNEKIRKIFLITSKQSKFYSKTYIVTRGRQQLKLDLKRAVLDIEYIDKFSRHKDLYLIKDWIW